MLSGKVPEWLGSSSNLKILNLRSNIFDESIPPELCQLKKIQILDLSNNNMSDHAGIYALFQLLSKIKDWFYMTTTINMARLPRNLWS
ncbi:hypothetical protein VitviT2T_005024 [Vitis vinifera]|uniref:Uncharacterized protein n=1 Tax=Vitis vinifera TaxID=29760 RepID=A0ABY9BS10_VITVI|nr:hypothetical protein VitviT2T_005024 [Vitis vinifera]